MNIIVTGSTSMIGVALIKEAIAHNTDVYAIIRPNSSNIKRLPVSDRIHLVKGKLEDMLSIEGLPNADVFYHLAWVGTAKPQRDDPILQERNIKYALDAVELAAKCHCRKFIGAGSQAEYGTMQDVISETTAVNPFMSYGMAKLSANMLCGKACEQKDMKFVWGRIFSVYGINDNTGTMLGYAIEKFIFGEEAVFSAAMQMWNYLYEADTGKIFYLLGTSDVSGVFNVANKESYPLCEFIKKLEKVCRDKFDLNVKYSFGEDIGDNMVSLHPNMTKLINAIGDIPMTSFEKGIENVIMAKLSDNSRGGITNTDLPV